jgi:L-aminopeptidase/D-esterase-like protein
VVLTGGSAFGLASATGVMRWFRERDVGFETTAAKVPIVSAAVLFDLAIGRGDVFPDEAAGYQAAAAARAGTVRQGTVGAGTGATVGKLLGRERWVKGGLGTASIVGPKGLVVGALAVTNTLGSVFDPETGDLVAGPRGDDGRFVPLAETVEQYTRKEEPVAENTTLVCVATNARLKHEQLQRVAYQAQDGLARTIVPAHTIGDGDVAFAIGMGTREPEPEDGILVGLLAEQAVERAILKSVLLATGLRGAPSVGEWLAQLEQASPK